MRIYKIPAYDLYANTTGTARFARVCDLLAQRIDPPTQHPQSFDCKSAPVYCSSLQRAHQCVDPTSTPLLTLYPGLNEIPFELSQFCDSDTFARDGSTAVRLAFVTAFANDALLIPLQQIKDELLELERIAAAHPTAIAITHTFRMKIIELYVERGDRIFDDPEQVLQRIDPRRHLYPFGATLSFREVV